MRSKAFDRFRGYSVEKCISIILFVSVLVAISFGVGFIFGQLNAINVFTKLAVKVLEIKGSGLNIDESAIAQGIFQYGNNIK